MLFDHEFSHLNKEWLEVCSRKEGFTTTIWTDVSEEGTASFSGFKICLASNEQEVSIIYSTLNVAAVRSSETSVNFYRATWRHIREDATLYSHCCESLKSKAGSSEVACI
jgi:hypothetical protein